MSGVVKKIFSKSMASILIMVMASTFSFFANACKQPFPKGVYRIFNVAVIGSNIGVDGKPQDQPMDSGTSANKIVMDALCRVGTKLEKFDGAEVLNDDKISFAGREFPRASALIDRNIFCFYDIANVYSSDILRECPYAICPYRVDTAEVYDAWTERMTKLRNFVKRDDNMWCDLGFLGIIEGIHSEEVSKYITTTQRIASGPLDIYNYQQTVNTSWIFSTNMSEGCASLISEFVTWDREELFKQCTHKSFPKIISNEGMKPVFSRIDQASASLFPPVGLKVSSPKDATCIQSTDSFPPKENAALDIYNRCFFVWGPQGVAPANVQLAALKNFLEYGLTKREIFNGLNSIKLVPSRRHPERSVLKVNLGYIPERECGPFSSDEVEECYFRIFGNPHIRDRYVKNIKRCLDKGCAREHLIDRLGGKPLHLVEGFGLGNLYIQSGSISVESGSRCSVM